MSEVLDSNVQVGNITDAAKQCVKLIAQAITNGNAQLEAATPLTLDSITEGEVYSALLACGSCVVTCVIKRSGIYEGSVFTTRVSDCSPQFDRCIVQDDI